MMKKLLFLTIISVGSLEVLCNEPHCACSKFPYEEQLLEKMVRMEFAVERMKNEIKDTEQKVRKTLEEYNEIKLHHQKTVKHSADKKSLAFTATLSSDLSSLGKQQPIVFDRILTNNGLAYSGKTGVFTAPTNGVYYFMATVMSKHGQEIWTAIVKNGQTMVKMYSHDKAHEQGTSGVFLQLETSDEVWVIAIQGDKVQGNNWSSFSGFEISE